MGPVCEQTRVLNGTGGKRHANVARSDADRTSAAEVCLELSYEAMLFVRRTARCMQQFA